MKNLLVLSLVFASTLVTLAQTSNKKAAVSLFKSSDYSSHQDSLIVESNDDHSTTDELAFLHLKVVGLTTQSPVNADITIFYNSDFIKDRSGKAESGEFNASLNKFGWYIISLSAPGYFEATDTVWLINEKGMIFNKVFYLVPIEVGMSVTLNNINFNFGKTTLSEESFIELDKEVTFLNNNPKVVFEIAGYSDSVGPKNYNLVLSQGRAQTVIDYIVSQGAERAQLVAHGYGETRPAKSNETESGKANNRRVEFTVLSMNFESLTLNESVN
jgi:outer membrane protein OmpA-like peptidoglycan-associated protein